MDLVRFYLSGMEQPANISEAIELIKEKILKESEMYQQAQMLDSVLSVKKEIILRIRILQSQLQNLDSRLSQS